MDYIFSKTGRGGGRLATIEQVAQHAGVSVATVSRTLNNSPAVKPATAQRVREAIEELHYVPNQTARSLRRRATRSVRPISCFHSWRKSIAGTLPFFRPGGGGWDRESVPSFAEGGLKNPEKRL